MIELIRPGTKINFTSKFTPAAIISTVVTLSAFVLIIFKGFNYGVDFRGGAEIQLKFKQEINLHDLRTSLIRGGFDGTSVQSIGDPVDHEYLVKVLATEKNLNEITQKISSTLEKEFASSGAEIRKTDIVGPKAGAELRSAALKAIIYSLLAILIYIGLRFDFKYAPGAIISLVHDVAIVLGIWSLAGIEFSLQTVAVVLTIIGYSVNDTVVIYDRVRENEEKNPGRHIADVLDTAVNETLSRTILTHGVTFLSSISMFIWGGQSLRDFFLAMSIGIVVGTYSSIFIASSMTVVVDNAQWKKKAAIPSPSASA